MRKKFDVKSATRKPGVEGSMRILVINYEYPPIGGGGGFVTRDILENMAGSGHEISIFTSGFRGLKKYEFLNGVRIYRVPILFRTQMEVASLSSMLSYIPSAVLSVIHYLKGQKYDVINTHFSVPSGPAGYLLSKMLRIPNVLSIHGGDIYDPSKALSPHKTPILRDVVRLMLNKADRVVAQSEDTKRNAVRYYGVSRQIDIIPLGIKKPIFVNKKRSDFGLPEKLAVFGTIGRLVKRKNIEDTLEVLAGIKNDFDFRLLIIGEGPQRPSLKGLATQLGIGGRVIFFGNVSDEVKFQLLSLCDGYLSTALHEGFGLVFLEAMECGLPVICYDRGGQSDFLINGKTGFLVPFGDKKTFQEKIIDILHHPDLRREMAENNTRLVKKYYINECADRYVSLFGKVIENYNRGR